MGALFERLRSSRLAESALITVCGVMASRREATKPTAISTAMAALAEEKVPQKEALVVECVVVQGGGAPQLPGPWSVSGPEKTWSTALVTEADEPPGAPEMESNEHGKGFESPGALGKISE